MVNKTQHNIEINASIKTHLQDFDKVVNDLRKGLEEGSTKLDLTKGMGKDLSKLITKFQADFSKIKSLAPNDLLKLSDSAEFQRTGENIVKTFRQIQQIVSEVNTKSIVDVKKMFPDAFDSRVNDLLKKLDSFASRASEIEKYNQQIVIQEANLAKLKIRLEELEGIKPTEELQAEVNKTTESFNKATEAVENLKKSLSQQLGKNPITDQALNAAKTATQEISKNIENLQARAQKIDPGGVVKKGNSYSIGGKNIKEWAQAEKAGNKQAAEAQEILRTYREQNKELKIQSELLSNLTLARSASQKKPEDWTKEEAAAVAAQLQQSEQLADANKKSEEAAKSATKAQQELNRAAQAAPKKQAIELDIKKTEAEIERLKQAISSLKNLGDLTGLKEKFAELKINFSPQMLESAEGIALLKRELDKIDTTAFDVLKAKLKELAGDFPEVAQALKQFETGMGDAKNKANDLFSAVSQMDQLKSRIAYFFGITNSINLFKRAVQSAINTVKELDAVMTETAVVTDFTIGDMWDKLPEYSANATKLGASIKDLYSATTLYYQQGLQTEAAMSVGIETMKMARIANLGAADATQAMTAALRGFNMEVDEVNAQRVNDVYSELAAITAADTGQIADAMTKTASIAHSANMEFETTAALLAQIIETTQEAPETAGTAMKTIIARFTEVKQLFNEGMLTGEDSEGEVVDINKIDAALRTVGISLKDFLNGSKGIDDIFLELAEKWDTLDLATQRYIATTAAGSRQQSRFIAMMSNYERTMELVTAANNSAGASQDQFDKTLDSLAAKTQKLNNAWAEFTMGLANNELLKFGVDILTGLLTIVNKFTDFLSGNNGIAKSLITLTLAITALNGARVVLAKIFGSSLLKTVVESFDKIKVAAKDTGTQAGQSVKTGIVTALKETVAESAKAGAEGGRAYSQSWNQNIHLKNQQVHLGKPTTNYYGKKKARVGEVSQTSTTQTTPTTNLDTPATSPQQEVKLFDKAMQSTSISALYLAGTLTTLTGVGLNAASSLFKGKEGTDALGVGLETAGATASIAGSAISLLAPVLSTLGVSVGTLIIPIGIAVVAIGALAGVMHAVYKNSPAGKLEQTEKAAERAGEAANNAAESFNNLNTALGSLDNKYKNLEELTRGTKEWNAAVRETNQEVLDLIEKYPALAAFVESNNGVLTFNKDPNKTNTQGKNFNEIYAGYEAAVGNSQIVKIKADAEVEAARQIADADQKMRDLGLDNDTDFGRGYAWITSESGVENRWSYDAEKIFNDVARAASIGADNGGLDIKYGEGAENTDAIQEYLQSYFKENQEELGLAGFDEQQIQQAATTLGIQLTRVSDELATWGNNLVSSDEKIKAYNDTLIAQARDSSGIYDKELGNMAENFVTNEMFARFEKESKKDPTKLSEQDYEDYALNVLGGYYKDKKFYNAAGEVQEDITDEQVAQGLATVNATKMAADAMVNFADKINNIKISKDGKDFGIKNLYTKAQGQGLTLQDFQNLGLKTDDGKIDTNEENIKEVAKYIFNNGEELKNSYGSIDEFVDYFINEVGFGAEYYNQTMEKLGQSWWGRGQEGIFGNQSQLDIGSMGAIVDQLYNVFLTSGKSASDSLGGYLQEAFNKIKDPEQAQLFANALNTIDWKNIDSVEKLNEYLIDFGFDATAAGIDVEDLEEKIKDFAKATKNINLDSLKEEIKSLDELAEDLVDREETERVFSDEEKKALLKANPDMANDFVMTGIDEWTYIGDSMGTLEEAVREATKALWETYSEQTREAGEKSQSWQDLSENNRLGYDMLQGIATGTQTIDEPLAVDSNFYTIFSLMKSRGLLADNITTNDISALDLTELVKRSYDQYGAVAVRTENIANAQDASASDYATAYYSNLSGQEILNTKNNKEFAGLSETEAAQARTEALQALAVTEEGLTIEIEASSEALRVNKEVMSAAAIDAAADRKEMSKLADTIHDNKKALDKANKGTAEYQKALNKITTVAKKAFSKNITGKFIEENIEAFEDWAEGAEGSTERIRAAMMSTALQSAEELDSILDNTVDISEAIQQLDKLDFDIYGHADFSDVISEIKMTSEQAEMFKALVESLGYSVVWEITPGPITEDGTQLNEYHSIVISNTAERARQNNAVNNSSSGGGSSQEPYENSFDKLYNLVREINEEVREMARLERRYEKLLEENDISVGDLRDNLVDQLSQLYRQKFLNENLQTERRTQIQDYLAENSDLARYADIFQNERGEDVLRINWEQIDLVQDPDKGQRIEDYVGQLEEWMDGLDDIESELWDIEDQIEEIRNTGKQEYLDLEQALREAVEYSYQQEIDKLSQINDSINDTNAKLINSIQKQISKIRQDRENEKREEELADKQRQMLYLSQDTSGANGLSILQLQDEIDQGTQDYTDSLIDQKINELQEQNEDAAAQREKQIQLMQAQLDYSIKTGQIWDEVYLLIDEGLDKETGLIRGSQLETLLKNKDGFAGMSQLEKMEWLKELEQSTAMAAVFMSGIEEELIRKEFIQNIHYEMTLPEAPWSGGGGGWSGGGITSKVPVKDPEDPPKETVDPNKLKLDLMEKKIQEQYEEQLREYEELLRQQEFEREFEEYLDRIQRYQDAYEKGSSVHTSSGGVTHGGGGGRFATGGLADFTGPAWLDGTKSRPELVLNARDTQNFIQLKDILSSLLSRTSSTNNASTENNGDITYDIDINVETMSSDYDVEQVANKVKSLINEDARYRNNNAVSLTR